MSNYIEYDETTKELAESLYNMLRTKHFMKNIAWSSFPVEDRIAFYAMIDDILEQSYELDDTDYDVDEDL